MGILSVNFAAISDKVKPIRAVNNGLFDFYTNAPFKDYYPFNKESL